MTWMAWVSTAACWYLLLDGLERSTRSFRGMCSTAWMAESLAWGDHRELPTENRQAAANRTDTPRVGTSPPLCAEAHLSQLQGSPLQDFCWCARPAS